MQRLTKSCRIIRDANRTAIRVHANNGHSVASTHSAKRAELYRQRAINGQSMSIKILKKHLM